MLGTNPPCAPPPQRPRPRRSCCPPRDRTCERALRVFAKTTTTATTTERRTTMSAASTCLPRRARATGFRGPGRRSPRRGARHAPLGRIRKGTSGGGGGNNASDVKRMTHEICDIRGRGVANELTGIESGMLVVLSLLRTAVPRGFHKA